MNYNNTKRVYCLYRVSTKGQVDKNDIPMQKQSCRAFAEQNGWTIVKGLYEKGISGYKISANERDAIVEIKKAAEKGLYDILLVFMFDRIGRKHDETPFVVEWLSKKGIEVWSVNEGRQRFESHIDSLISTYTSGRHQEKVTKHQPEPRHVFLRLLRKVVFAVVHVPMVISWLKEDDSTSETMRCTK